MTWKQLTERDCREWKLSAIDPHDRHTQRSGVRPAMHAASQLPGRGPTDVDVALHVNKKSDDDDDDDNDDNDDEALTSCVDDKLIIYFLSFQL